MERWQNERIKAAKAALEEYELALVHQIQRAQLDLERIAKLRAEIAVLGK